MNITLADPPKNGEFRVFNQFTEFCSLNDLAYKKGYASINKINAKISHIDNPRIEEEDHYYNPRNTLMSLGLELLSLIIKK